MKKGVLVYFLSVLIYVVLFMLFMNVTHADIVINEFLPDSNFSASQDKLGEWIEIFNDNSFSVNLSEWNISETSATAGNFTIKNTTIAPQSYIVFVFSFSFFNASHPEVNASGIKIIEYGSSVPNFILN
ncbi:MAG: lamin tail domain-containing protein, partial [Nanoarchaeota archaeon]